MSEYRIRRAVALGTTAVAPVVFASIALAVGVSAGPPLLVPAVVFAVVVLAAIPIEYRRVRRRTLRISDEGLVVQRDKYQLRVAWVQVTGVERRRHQLLLVVDELVVRDAQIIALDSSGKPTRVPAKLKSHPATRRVMVSLYDHAWREGPIGDQLRAAGVLEPADAR